MDGARDFRFRLFGAEVGGEPVDSVELFSVNVADGIFAVEINFGFDPWYLNEQYWLEVEVGPADGSQSYEVVGRQKLTATPYALNTRGISVDENGNVGIFTDNPAGGLSVTGGQVASNPTEYGVHLGLSGADEGVIEFASPEGRRGIIDFNAGTDSGRLQYRSSDDTLGLFNADVLVAQDLIVDGIIGLGTGTPQSRLDVRFSAGNGIEVTDSDTVSSGIGVHSIVGAGTGVRGESSAASGSHFGVYGQAASLSGWGVFSNGRLGASGTKSFMIDHPLDPTGKYLLHYSSESPEPQNRYNGNAYLDAHGVGVVTLPTYFESINRDFRYTLTPIGGAAPNLHVAREIQGNAFVIAGGAPGMKVSWEVTAVRDDAFVRLRGAPVEVEKVGRERGMYLTPGLYGAPERMGIHSADLD